MNWPAALFAATIWIIAASLWQFFRPMPETSSHRQVAYRAFQDIAPAILIGLLMARIL